MRTQDLKMNLTYPSKPTCHLILFNLEINNTSLFSWDYFQYMYWGFVNFGVSNPQSTTCGTSSHFQTKSITYSRI
uniref:Uncharacterized protein n=1 Tax=Lepeophtheirus salmonis TaxID=72036 RepID=A0A0K2VFC1_LEPSM